MQFGNPNACLEGFSSKFPKRGKMAKALLKVADLLALTSLVCK